MAHRDRGELRLPTALGTFTLRLTVGICGTLEDQTEQDFDQVTERVNRGRLSESRWLLWAALQSYHATDFPTVEHVTPLIEAIGGSRSLRAVLSLLLARNADPDPPKPSDAKAGGEPSTLSIWSRLYIDARVAGITPDQFWGFSLRELWMELAAIRRAHREQQQLAVMHAWWVAALVWQKKLPDLGTLLDGGRAKTPQPQTWQEMKAAFRAAVAARARKQDVDGDD